MATFIQYQTKESLYDGAFNNQVGWRAAGMADIVIGENGGLMVIDGGYEEDADGLIALLENYSHGKPEIDLWIITHAHRDHSGALKQIAFDDALRSRIRVKKIVWWFPSEFCNRQGESGALNAANDEMLSISRVLQAEEYRPVLAEKLVFDDVRVEFVYVPDDCSIFKTAGGNANYASLVFTLQGREKRIMVTGDAYALTMQLVAQRYGNALKCDALQMPHHALCDSYCAEFYKFVDPDILFEPISSAGYRAMHADYATDEGAIINAALEKQAAIVYKAFEGTSKIEF